MTRPTRNLVEDHGAILVLLDVLEHLGEAAQRGALPLEAAATAVDLVRRFADAAHHGKEERHLFPAMIAAGLPARHGPLGCMLREHEQGRAYVRRMGDALEAARRDGDAAAFAAPALAFATHLRHHIAKEDHVLFPMAEERVPAEALAALGSAFEAVERDVLGEGGAAAARAAVRRLRDEVLGQPVGRG